MRDRRPSPRLWHAWAHELTLAGLLAVFLMAAYASLPAFLEPTYQLRLSRHAWESAILALGMTMVIVAGGIDLSVGSMMGLCAVTFGMSHLATGSLLVSSILCLVVGCVAGALNGLLVAKYHIHPLIVTLATYAAYRGIAEGASQGTSYSQFGSSFVQLARGSIGGVPIPAFLFAGLVIVSGAVLGATPAGRFLYAIGHNARAARMSGVPVDTLRWWLYTWSGILVGLATLVYVARFDAAKADAGMGLELDVITAVVIGGAAITGGRGNLIGTILGVLLIHETRLFVGRYWRIEELKPILVGLLLIGSILIRNLLSRKDSH